MKKILTFYALCHYIILTCYIFLTIHEQHEQILFELDIFRYHFK